MYSKLYLAGKIAKNDWRHKIFPRLRDMEKYDYDFCVEYAIGGKYLYCGPFFVSCDHGCYHGPNTHGVGIDSDFNCMEVPYLINKQTTVENCYNAIDMSDVVFVWIENITCYGTLAEIGYAYAKKKRIFIAMHNTCDPANDLWFIKEQANCFIYEQSCLEAWAKFLEWDK